MSEYDTCTTQKALSVLHINGQIIKLLLCRLLDPQQTHIHMNALTFQFLCKQRTHADNFQVWPTSLSDTVAHSHQAITTQEPRLCLTSQIHSKWTQVRMTGSATVFFSSHASSWKRLRSSVSSSLQVLEWLRLEKDPPAFFFAWTYITQKKTFSTLYCTIGRLQPHMLNVRPFIRFFSLPKIQQMHYLSLNIIQSKQPII